MLLNDGNCVVDVVGGVSVGDVVDKFEFKNY